MTGSRFPGLVGFPMKRAGSTKITPKTGNNRHRDRRVLAARVRVGRPSPVVSPRAGGCCRRVSLSRRSRTAHCETNAMTSCHHGRSASIGISLCLAPSNAQSFLLAAMVSKSFFPCRAGTTSSCWARTTATLPPYPWYRPAFPGRHSHENSPTKANGANPLRPPARRTMGPRRAGRASFAAGQRRSRSTPRIRPTHRRAISRSFEPNFYCRRKSSNPRWIGCRGIDLFTFSR